MFFPSLLLLSFASRVFVGSQVEISKQLAVASIQKVGTLRQVTLAEKPESVEGEYT